ncbi:hypothetical protein [Lysobacter enzymogenes]|uniref:hypothetical protein n=1 Tax=Lysobacter enzymogenes TaxID=69 RepID=UPI001A95C152|nr:hypothetical protein [Lysobacter enzymogenes]QQP95919.1 hypothetical protein JHW38_22325 [Lysobacter enzymogenes]
MPPLAKNVLLALCFPTGLLAAGYLNAWAALDACAEQVYRQDSGRSGVDMRGRKRPLQRADITARIRGPFQVEASYMLPADLHGSVHTRTYFVLGGYRHLLDSQEIHLVRAGSLSGSWIATTDVGASIAASVAARPERG